MSKEQTYDYYQSKIDWLEKNKFYELDPLEYYRLIFREGSFQNREDPSGDFKPNGLLQYRNPDFSENSMSCVVIHDDLQTIQNCVDRYGRFENHEFVLVSGCSYIGSQKTNKNARYCHAIIIDVDEVDDSNLSNLIGIAEEGIIPIPTAIVVSGNGIHVTYVLDEPVPLYSQKAEMLKNLKMMLIRKIWNKKTSKDANVQYQGIVQGYRAVGTKTKKGHIVRAFKFGNVVTIDELIETIEEIDILPFLTPNKKRSNGKIDHSIYSDRIKKCLKDKKLTQKMFQELVDFKWTMKELQQKNPKWFEDWYQHRIVEKQKAGHLHIGRKPYEKWLKLIKEQARQGNRRRCIYCLAAFAQKCDISEEEFVKDAYSLFESFNALTIDKSNPFKKSDIDWAVQQYKEANLIKMSFLAMERMTGIKYPKEEQKHSIYDKAGRPDKEMEIRNYIAQNPNEINIAKIARECHCSRPTVYKYLNQKVS